MKNSRDYSSEHESHEHRSALLSLFELSLKDIYWAEKSLTKELPKMAEKATAKELVEALNTHLEETEGHVQKIEKIFEMIGKKAVAKKCEAMDGLIKEAEDLMKETEEGPQRDAAIIFAAQKAEHYEIATYGTLATFARTLGLVSEANLLKEILSEEKNADHILTQIAVASINMEALQEEEGMEAEEE